MQIRSIEIDVREYVELNFGYKKEDVARWFIDYEGKFVIQLKANAKKIEV
jgi:hypothetical protein